MASVFEAAAALSRSIERAVEFIPGRLYLLPWDPSPEVPVLRDTAVQHFFFPGPRFTYTPFHHDFGPLNISKLHLFCEQFASKLKEPKLEHKRVYFVTPTAAKELANNALLMCAFAVLTLGDSPAIAFMRLGALRAELQPFRDASPKTSTFHLTVLNILEGLHKAKLAGLYRTHDFSVDSYEHYEQVCNGDINWIAPRRMYAFSGPHATKEDADNYSHSTPADYLEYFRDNNITDVVRLSESSYKPEDFTAHGLVLHDFSFEDGSVPNASVVGAFLNACSSARGAVAVHCRAGLGRTGTLIALWLMKEYRFTAREAIAWLRLCRPGSVMGPQQHFVVEQEKTMHARHDAAIPARHRPQIDSDDNLAQSLTNLSLIASTGVSGSSASLAVSSATSAVGSTADLAMTAVFHTIAPMHESRAESASSETACPLAHITSAAEEDRGALAHSLEWHTQQQVEIAAQEQAQYQRVLARKTLQAQQASQPVPAIGQPERASLQAPASAGSPLRRRSISNAQKLDLEVQAGRARGAQHDEPLFDPENTPPPQRKPSGRGSNPGSRRSSIGTWSDDALQAQIVDAAERLQRSLQDEPISLAAARLPFSTSHDGLPLRSPSGSKTNSPITKNSARRSSMQPIVNDLHTAATGEQ